MEAVSTMEPDVVRVRGVVTGLEESVGLAAAAFERLAGEGRDEDGAGRARVAAVMAARAGVEEALVGLAVHLDQEAARLAADFEAVKVGPLLPGRSRFFFRKADTHVSLNSGQLKVLEAEITAWLQAVETVLGFLQHLRQLLKRCHARLEAVLSELILRRGKALQSLEAAQKASEEYGPSLTEIRLRIAGAADGATRAELEAEQLRRETDLAAARTYEVEFLKTYQLLDDLTALLDVFLNTLNIQIAVQNAVMAKVEADQQRSVLLHAAVCVFSKQDSASGSHAGPLGRLSYLQARAAKGFIGHAETLRRKEEADAVFTRRFGPAIESGQPD